MAGEPERTLTLDPVEGGAARSFRRRSGFPATAPPHRPRSSSTDHSPQGGEIGRKSAHLSLRQRELWHMGGWLLRLRILEPPAEIFFRVLSADPGEVRGDGCAAPAHRVTAVAALVVEYLLALDHERAVLPERHRHKEAERHRPRDPVAPTACHCLRHARRSCWNWQARQCRAHGMARRRGSEIEAPQISQAPKLPVSSRAIAS